MGEKVGNHRFNRTFVDSLKIKGHRTVSSIFFGYPTTKIPKKGVPQFHNIPTHSHCQVYIFSSAGV